MTQFPSPEEPDLAGPAIQFSDVNLRYGATQILSNINLKISSGTIHALIGPNGGGKSSLIRCLFGLAPFSGEISIDWIRKKGVIGYVPQALEFDRSLPMTVMDFMVSMISDRPAFLKPEKQTETLILDKLRAVDMADKVTRRMGTLSGGERQRVLMAQSLIPSPSLLVLDEPMAALDDNGVRIFADLMQKLKAEHVTIFWVEHDLAAVKKLADTVTALSRTLLFTGNPEDILQADTILSLFSKASALSAPPQTTGDTHD